MHYTRFEVKQQDKYNTNICWQRKVTVRQKDLHGGIFLGHEDETFSHSALQHNMLKDKIFFFFF